MFIFSSVWLLLQARLTASLLSLPLHHAQFGLACLCWLGHRSPWLNKLCTADWVSFSPSVKASILFSPSSNTSRVRGFEFQRKWEEEEVSFPSFGRHFWLNAQLGQCAIGIVKTCFGLYISLGKWKKGLPIDERSRVHIIFKDLEVRIFILCQREKALLLGTE